MNMRLLILILGFGALPALCGTFDRKGLSQVSAVLRDGNSIEYGVSSSGRIGYVVIFPKGEVRVSKVLAGRDQIDIRLDYKGLNLDGPSDCTPLVVCAANRIDHWRLINTSEDKLLDLIGQKKSLAELASALRESKAGR